MTCWPSKTRLHCISLGRWLCCKKATQSHRLSFSLSLIHIHKTRAHVAQQAISFRHRICHVSHSHSQSHISIRYNWAYLARICQEIVIQVALENNTPWNKWQTVLVKKTLEYVHVIECVCDSRKKKLAFQRVMKMKNIVIEIIRKCNPNGRKNRACTMNEFRLSDA